MEVKLQIKDYSLFQELDRWIVLEKNQKYTNNNNHKLYERFSKFVNPYIKVKRCLSV